MVLINTLSYLLYFIGCILATISVSLLHDVFLSKNVIKTYLLKKIQTLVITLTLLATIFKYLIDLQDKYILVYENDFVYCAIGNCDKDLLIDVVKNLDS